MTEHRPADAGFFIAGAVVLLGARDTYMKRMARPSGSKNSYQWWTGDHPNKGKPKPPTTRACKRCNVTFTGPHGSFYCSRKCAFLNLAEQGDGCWEWKGYKRPGGYGEAYFGSKPNRERILAHRLAYEVMIEPPPADLVVCHKCDNPSCVNPDHLFLGTVADNTRDRDAKGRQARGERNGPAKLTEAQVKAIRRDPRMNRVIAKDYGVFETTISSIKHRKTWKHVQ